MNSVIIYHTNSTIPSHSVAYPDFVQTLIKKFVDYRLELCHAAMGVAGEAGELCDAIKRHAIYGKEADVKNIVEELGDLEFYMQDVRTKYNITREQTLQANADKLAERYKGLVYSDEAAIARADKILDAQSEFPCPTPNVTDEGCLRCITGEGECINKTHPIEVGNWGIPADKSIDNLENNK